MLPSLLELESSAFPSEVVVLGVVEALFFFRKGCYAQTLLAHLWRETLIPVLLDLYNKLMGTAGSRRCDLCYAAPAVLCGDLMACRTGSNS